MNTHVCLVWRNGGVLNIMAVLMMRLNEREYELYVVVCMFAGSRVKLISNCAVVNSASLALETGAAVILC